MSFYAPTGDPRRHKPRHEAPAIKCNLGDIIDLSASGVRIRCKGKPPVQPGLFVEMTFSNGEHRLRTKAQAVWIKRKGLRSYMIGLRFVDVKPGVAAAIGSMAQFGFVNLGENAANTKSSKSNVRIKASVDLPDYYSVLDVAPDATVDEIQTAYRHLARKHHPDVSKDPDSCDRFIQITQAYEVLHDPARRRTFDLRRAG